MNKTRKNSNLNSLEIGTREISFLKNELVQLEVKFQSLADKKNEYLKDIEEFNIHYNLYLGDIIENIFKLKKEILYKSSRNQKKVKKQYVEEEILLYELEEIISQIKRTLLDVEKALKLSDDKGEEYKELLNVYLELKDELKELESSYIKQEKKLDKLKTQLDEKIHDDLTFINKEYEEYHEECKNLQQFQEDCFYLNDEKKKELKILWKQACKLCHPDIVAEEFKEKAHKIIQNLNEAYSKKDIDAIKQILINLEKGIDFGLKSKMTDNKEQLLAKISEIKQKIEQISRELEKIKEDEDFIIISSIDSWDKYFSQIKKQLTQEKEELDKELTKKSNLKKLDFYDFEQNVMKCDDKYDFYKYLESSFIEIENYFGSLDKNELELIRNDIERFLSKLVDRSFLDNKNEAIVNSLLILIAEKFENAYFSEPFTILLLPHLNT